MAHDKRIDGPAETGEKLVAFDKVCTELPTLAARCPALISHGGVIGKRAQPI